MSWLWLAQEVVTPAGLDPWVQLLTSLGAPGLLAVWLHLTRKRLAEAEVEVARLHAALLAASVAMGDELRKIVAAEAALLDRIDRSLNRWETKP